MGHPTVNISKAEFEALQAKAKRFDKLKNSDFLENEALVMRTMSEVFLSYLQTEDYQMRIQSSDHESRIKELHGAICNLIVPNA